jgi:hypothetical protein
LAASFDTCACCQANLSKSSPEPGRCGVCQALVGLANQCGRCHAFSPVIARGDGFVCSACGCPRDRLRETVCMSDREVLQELEPRARLSPWLLALLCALPFLAGAGWSARRGAHFACALSLGGALLTFGLLLRAALRRGRLAARRRTFEIEQRIIGLAYQNDGVLREGEVSVRLRISLAEAREVLHELVRQERAVSDLQVNDRSEFRFGEARRTRAIRRRAGS